MKKLLLFIPAALMLYFIGYYTGMREYSPSVVSCSSVSNNVPSPKIKAIDWPEEFNGVMSETGQINSPMSFKMSGDTLRIEFDNQ